MCGPHFCSMKITQEVRAFAEQQGILEEEALQAGMQEQATLFKNSGSQVYS